MKRIISALCAVITAVPVFMTGCAVKGSGESGDHKLYLKTDYVYDEVKAVFVNKANGNTRETVMKRGEDGDGFFQYSCMGDTGAYNKVYFSYDGKETDEVAFNDLVDGWYISIYGVLPCTEGVAFSREAPLTRLTFPFQGEDKDVYVWTPEDYDPASEDKYSVIYLLDGDCILADERGLGTWNTPESVVSAMKHSDFKAIVVGIATRENTRYRELAPDLGTPREEVADEYDHRYGNEFCDFVVNTVVPGIEKQYNVYT
ncbi:MAG: alpha/beta hydrolase-fold protein, partial [Ruminococcus sp.]